LHLEFLYGIGEGLRLRVLKVGRCRWCRRGGNSWRWAVAADADGRALAGAPVERIHIAGLRAVADVRAWHGEHEIDEHAAIERKCFHGSGLDHFANAGVGGVQNVEHGGHDLQRAAGGSELEVEIEASCWLTSRRRVCLREAKPVD